MIFEIIALLAANALALTACVLGIRVGQNNHKFPQTQSKSPLNSKIARASGSLNNNALFRALDRIPLFRRSGNASVNDLAKALSIVLFISFVPAIFSNPLNVVLTSSAILFSVVACILFMHPALSHRQSFLDNIRGRSLFKSKGK